MSLPASEYQSGVDQFWEDMQSHGLACSDSPIDDGTLRRFKVDGDRGGSNNGWYVLYGDGLPAGSYGSWKTDESYNWCAKPAEQLTLEERRANSKRIEQVNKQREEERKSKRQEAAQRSREIWEQSNPAPVDHAYLNTKQIKPYGTRIANGKIIVPLRDSEGILHSLLFIADDESKMFKAGGRVSGCYFPIGEPTETVYICEGFSTAASVHEATQCISIVAFNAGNLFLVAKALRSKYPDKQIIICADNDAGNDQNVGFAKAREASNKLGLRWTYPKIADEKCDFNDVQVRLGLEEVKTQVHANLSNELASSVTTIHPVPLLTETKTAHVEYPIEALGDVLGEAAKDICEAVQCPKALAGQSLLAAAALTAQRLFNIEIDGRVMPLSLNLISIAESGDRKSAADNIALAPIHDRQKELIAEWEQDKLQFEIDDTAHGFAKAQILKDRNKSQSEIGAELAELDRPVEPIFPIFISQEPTLEGIHKSFQRGLPSQGLFSDEGGQFFGGHAMNPDNALKTMAGLSKLWDGAEIIRTRSGDESFALYNRRFSSHLMIQPIVANRVIGDPLLQGQGLLARFLVAGTKSLAGTRLYKSLNANESPAVQRYTTRLKYLISKQVPLDECGGLDLDCYVLNGAAKGLWEEAHNAIETKLGDNAELDAIKPAASKMAENIARISGVLAAIEECSQIEVSHMTRAIELGTYYLNEAQRLSVDAQQDEEQARAQGLLDWIKDKNGGEIHSGLFTKIPRPLKARSFKGARKLLQILEATNHVEVIKLDAKNQPNAWRVIT
jgi:phage/plasmid primase-like uncharacterized protein